MIIRSFVLLAVTALVSGCQPNGSSSANPDAPTPSIVEKAEANACFLKQKLVVSNGMPTFVKDLKAVVKGSYSLAQIDVHSYLTGDGIEGSISKTYSPSNPEGTVKCQVGDLVELAATGIAMFELPTGKVTQLAEITDGKLLITAADPGLPPLPEASSETNRWGTTSSHAYALDIETGNIEISFKTSGKYSFDIHRYVFAPAP
ncbi:MAG: hypothetical protein V4692_07675 [Bdellovibrionota bacterium]